METIKKLKEAYLSKGYSLAPYSEEQIAAAIKKHKNIPAILVEYYSQIGAISDEESFTIHILSPAELHITSDGEESPRNILVFAEEMQGVITLGILKNDLKSDNPLLYGSGDVFEEYLDDDEDYQFLAGDMYAATSRDSDTTFLSILDLLWGIASMELGIANPMQQDTLDPRIIAKKEKALAKKRKIEQTELAHDIVCGNADASLITDEMVSIVTKLSFSTPPNVDLLAKFVKLKSLEVQENTSPDISWIASLKELTSLILTYQDIEDISPLRNLTKLSFVILRGNKIKDISPLSAAKNLKELYLGDNSIMDTSSFLNLSDKLTVLELANNSILSIEGLQNFVNLDILNLANTLVGSIETLAMLDNLRVLYLRKTLIKDISPLKDLKMLETLDIRYTQVASLAPLQHIKHKMWSLYITGAPIRDLDSIKGLKVEILEK